VEDEWLIADDLIRAIEREGAQVVGPAASADHALYLLNTSEVHIAVLDIHLGAGRDIYAVAEELRRRKVPFMFATGYDDTSVRRDFARVPHLMKPYEPTLVVKLLSEVVADPVAL